ncbi:peroxide stress protein YaaA [Lipingzhangella sp. LS1_29]|uniref:Peroxide stress protein YaaA n=1 Tax=Lipingzhangella rawalii TaxID=2055835 RepID=A0ABU2H8G3_9ACTN|nr:peroxide stress protein YaaA [Lipingzhangella rawalii]MDS1271277.1 peroxide stress protein YaaA [Lipingzhangella rawalii]
MFVLLPPSAGKAPAGNGPPVDFSRLTFPDLTWPREQVLAELEKVCADDQGDPAGTSAREILGLSARQGAAVTANRELRHAPTLPAAQRYTGVLYDALDLPGLRSGPSGLNVTRSVLIFSGLWGVLGIDDVIPDYRLSMDVRLPALGRLSTFWRGHLQDPLREHTRGHLLVDCRSAAYAPAFRGQSPAGDHRGTRTVTIRVLRERSVEGRRERSVVSHHAKAARGRVAHALLANDVHPESPAELVDALRAQGFHVERSPDAHSGSADQIDVIEQG